MTKREILDNVKLLPREEQLDLAMELWDLVELREEDLELTEEQKVELDRRVAEAEANPQAAEDWESLKARLLRGDF